MALIAIAAVLKGFSPSRGENAEIRHDQGHGYKCPLLDEQEKDCNNAMKPVVLRIKRFVDLSCHEIAHVN